MKNIVHFIECEEFMRDLPDNYYDLACCDPPYGIGADKMQMGSAPNRQEKGKYPSTSTAVKIRAKNRLNQGSGKLKNRLLNKSDCSWDIPPGPEYFEELFRISKNQIIWGGNYFDLPPTRGIFCWDKRQPWENFSQFEFAWMSFDVPSGLFSYSNTGGANAEKKIHETQKPVNLYKDLLRRYAKPGDIIFDSHVGSRSLGIACYDMGFDFEGCENDLSHFNDQEDRYRKHTDPEYAYQASVSADIAAGQPNLF